MYYLPRPNQKKFIYRSKRLSEEIREGYKMLIATLVFLSITSGFFYIKIQTNSAVLGYRVSELQSINENLKNKNYDLTYKVLQAESVLSLNDKTFASNMISIDQDNLAYVNGNTDMAVLPIRVENLNK